LTASAFYFKLIPTSFFENYTFMISLQSAEFVATSILLLASYAFSSTITQAGQAWIARLMGDDTAAEAGWLSLNPLVHINTLSAILVLFFGFGVVSNMPINYRNFEHHEGKLFIACMGQVICSILLTFVALLLLIITFGHGLELIIGDFQNRVPIGMIAQFYPEKSTLSIIWALLLIALIVYNLFIIMFGFIINIIDYYLILRYKDGMISLHNPSVFLASWLLAIIGVLFFGLALRSFFFWGIIKTVSIICRLLGV
jgi:hypothetical protein